MRYKKGWYIKLRASEDGSCSVASENISFGTSDFDTRQRITIYGEIVGGAVIMASIKAIMTILICLSAAGSLHSKMLKSILRAPLLFFDTNPVGK